MFIYFGFKSFIRLVFCEYLLPVCGLSSCSYDIIFHRTKIIYVFIFLKIYLFIYDRQIEREAETQEGEAGSMQGARCRTRSQDPRITPWAEGNAKPLSHLGCPGEGASLRKIHTSIFLKKLRSKQRFYLG